MAEETSYQDVDDEQFINELRLWVMKQGKYPLELITFVKGKDGTKLIAMPTYASFETHIYLGAKGYDSYQSALAKVGALMDKMDYPKYLDSYKASNPLSFPGYVSADELN